MQIIHQRKGTKNGLRGEKTGEKKVKERKNGVTSPSLAAF